MPEMEEFEFRLWIIIFFSSFDLTVIIVLLVLPTSEGELLYNIPCLLKKEGDRGGGTVTNKPQS